MSKNLTYLTNDLAVYSSTIRATSISTADTTNGYRRNDGTQRGISHGITTDGIHMLWVTTNGDPAVVADDIEDAIRVCCDLGDAEDHNVDADTMLARVIQGAERIISAAAEIASDYKGNDSAVEELEWFADKAREVLTACKDDRDLVLSALQIEA